MPILRAFQYQPQRLFWLFSDNDYSYLFQTQQDLVFFLNFLLRCRTYLAVLKNVTLENLSFVIDAFTETNFIPRVFDVMITEDNEDLLSTCEEVLCSLFGKNYAVVSVEPSLLSSFVLRMSSNMKKVRYITPLLLQTVVNSPDLNHISELGLISALLTGSKGYLDGNETVLNLLIDISKHLSIRIRLKNRKDEVISFVNHLIEFELISYLINSMIWRYQNHPFLQTFTEFVHLTVPQQEIVELISDISAQLQQIMKLDEKYLNMVLEYDIPPQLFPLLFDGL